MSAEQLQKVGKGALIAAAGAALTYISQWASGVDFGLFTLLAGAVLSVAVNFVHKLSQQTSAN